MAPAIAPLFIPGGLGGPELVIILLIAVLLFGANKIPKLARATGQAMGEFQRGREELEDELNEVGDLSESGGTGTQSEGATETESQTQETETQTETETQAETETERESSSNSGN